MNEPFDRIALIGLTVRGFHGVLAEERSTGQDFVVDAELELDTRPAAASDELADTVNYADIAERLASIVAGDPVDLIETLATRLADACLADHRVHAVTLTVHKPDAPLLTPFTDVSVRIRREQRGSGDAA